MNLASDVEMGKEGITDLLKGLYLLWGGEGDFEVSKGWYGF